MKRIYFFFLSILFISSCSDKAAKDGYQLIDVSDTNKEVFDWANVMRVNRIIPLEATERSLLGLAQKCLVKNNRILFLDYKMKSIYLFDMDGRFLFSIDSQGGGAEEYIELKDAIFSNDGKKIFVLDHTAVLAYDAIDGHFLDRMNFDVNYSSNFYRFVNLGEDLFYFFADSGDYTIYRYANHVFSGIRESKGYQLVYERFHCQDAGYCLVAPDYGLFTIDQITKEGLTPKYFINFGNKSMPESMLPKNSREFDKVEKESYFKSIVEVKETNQGIYIQAVDPENKYYHIYVDSKTGKLVSGVSDSTTNLAIVDANSTFFYGLIYPDYFSEKSKLYNELKEYVQEEGNPILIEFTINEDFR